MSGPRGTATRRDRRRDTRRAQYEARGRLRQLETQRRLRRQQMQRYAVYAGAALVVILFASLIIHAVTSGGGAKSNGAQVVRGTGTQTQPAYGQAIDGMQCSPAEQFAQHLHAYLLIYANGQPYTVPGGTGIPAGANCVYPVHVHRGQDNIIHVESP